MSVHLSVEVHLSVWVVLYGDRHILSYLCSRTSVSVSSILRLQNICLQYIYILKAYALKSVARRLTLAGLQYKEAWLIITYERLCRVFLFELHSNCKCLAL